MTGRRVDAFYVRKVRKEHGACQLIEGHLKQGAAEALAKEGVTLLSFFKGSDFELDR